MTGGLEELSKERHTMAGGRKHKAGSMFLLVPNEKWSSWQRKHRPAWNIVRATSPKELISVIMSNAEQDRSIEDTTQRGCILLRV